MQTSQGNLLTRDDTMLGICQALGEDFGFNPNILRIALACALLWNPVAVIGGYLALGVVVAISRLAAPNKRAKQAAEAPVAEAARAVAEPVAEARQPELAKAA